MSEWVSERVSGTPLLFVYTHVFLPVCTRVFAIVCLIGHTHVVVIAAVCLCRCLCVGVYICFSICISCVSCVFFILQIVVFVMRKRTSDHAYVHTQTPIWSSTTSHHNEKFVGVCVTLSSKRVASSHSLALLYTNDFLRL